LEKQTVKIKAQLDKIKAKFSDKKLKQKSFTGICFLTFQKQLDAEHILDTWGINFLGTVIIKYVGFLKNLYKGKKERFKKQVITVTEPPEPLDIYWENLGTPISLLIKTRIITTFLSGILLCFSFGAILLLKYGQVVYLKTQNVPFIRTLLSLAISFSISFINGILGFSLRKLSAKERYETKTSYNIGVAKRIAFVSFFREIFQTIFFREI
jgi:hypothetical protein